MSRHVDLRKRIVVATGSLGMYTAHGHLGASLTVVEPSPVPSQTQTEKVQLVQQKPHGKAKK